jgi:hypothetical protein
MQLRISLVSRFCFCHTFAVQLTATSIPVGLHKAGQMQFYAFGLSKCKSEMI